MKPLALELSFDAASDLRLGREWSRLSSLYDRPSGAELGVRPHITLALFRESEPPDLIGVARSTAATLSPFRLKLVTVDRFPGDEGVVFLRPEGSSELVRAHGIANRLLGSDRKLVDAYYRPDAWKPHCTMAIGVPETMIDLIVSACHESGCLGEVEVQGVQVVRYHPATEIWTAGLE